MHFSSDTRTELFRSSWLVYDAILEKNYMFHREIQSVVRSVIAPRAALGDYCLLDLGCGNTRGIAQILRDFPPTRYLGVDVSRSALHDAALEVEGLSGVELHENDMLPFVEAMAPGSVDLIYSGFAMHHLSTGEKTRLMQATARALSPEGSFLLADVIRDSEESREQYLDNYLRMIAMEWTGLSALQVEQVQAHVRAHDFPETWPTLAEMAHRAGFERTRLLACYRQHQVVLCSLPQNHT